MKTITNTDTTELFENTALAELKAFTNEKVETIRECCDQMTTCLAASVRSATDYLNWRVKAGLALLELKARLSRHGTWSEVAENRFPWLHERSRQRLMADAAKWQAGELPLDHSKPEHLQLAFDGLDFKPVLESHAKPTKSDSRVVYATAKYSTPFWNLVEKVPLAKWPTEERDTFAEDTARRVKLLEQAGIKLPEIIDIEPTPKP